MNIFFSKQNISSIIMYFIFMLLGCITAYIGYFSFNYQLLEHVPFLKKSPFDYVHHSVTVYDRSWKLLSMHNNSRYCYFYEFPDHLVNAFVISEDREFFKHQGISFRSIIRSIIKNIVSRNYTQGASTITQQMIKLMRGDLSKTLYRKVSEQIYALIIELRYGKQEIFEKYLNVLYFGKGITGVSHICLALWNKQPSELTLAQSATLAAIIQLPEKFNPLVNPSLCLKKRNIILKKMRTCNVITQEEYDDAHKEDLSLQRQSVLDYNRHIGTYIKHVYEKYYNNNCIFFTTFDSEIQSLLCQTIELYKEALQSKYKDMQCSCAIIENKTGAVVAIYNGFLNNNMVNRCLMKKQVASLIKPFVVYYAFIKGDDENSIYIDEPLSLYNATWNPYNNNKKFLGPMTIENALIQSNNIVPIKILLHHGVDDFAHFINETGLFFHTYPYISLALGCVESDVIHMACAMSLFVNQGEKKNPFCVEKILNVDHYIQYKNSLSSNIILQKDVCNKIRTILLKSAVLISKKLKIDLLEDCIAKTGTTNNAKTCWFAGSTKKYSLALWLGTDNNKDLSGIISSTFHAAPIGLMILKKLSGL